MIEREGNQAVVQFSEDAFDEAASFGDFLKSNDGVEGICFLFAKDIVPDNIWVPRFLAIVDRAKQASLSIDWDSVPDRFERIYRLARSTKAHQSSGQHAQQSIPEQVGHWAFKQWEGTLEVAEFTGQYSMALVRMIQGRAAFPWHEIWRIFRDVSVGALPIVALISFLVGLIIAFLGAVVLMQFGAEFAVSYLVGFGMFREMGAIMTGVIMAGRTGAAYAAQIGSMKVNEELDALETFGISPMEFIVLPRLIALTITMPLLTIFANLIGIFGGFLVAEFMMDVPGEIFFAEMNSIVGISDFLLGIFKATAFGLLVATAGCLRGLQSGRGASAVGEAATRAVVTGITLIIVANAFFDWAAATFNF